MAAVTAFRGTNKTMDSRIYLTLLTWLCLPITTILAALCWLYERMHNRFRRAQQPIPNHRTILISGSSPTAASLSLSLRSCGHHVLGTTPKPSLARIWTLFKSMRKIYNKAQWEKRRITLVLRGIKIQFDISLPLLPKPKPARSIEIAEELLSIMQRENADIWIPCPSSEPLDDELAFQQAVETVRAQSPVGILHTDIDTAEMLTDESAFTEYVEQLEIGIRAPAYHVVTSRDEIHKLLARNHKIVSWELEEDLEAAGATPTEKLSFEDSARRRHTWPPPPQDTMTPPESNKNSPIQAAHLHPTTFGKVILPLSSKNATYQCVAGMGISQHRPWIMREIISGQKITAHLLIINNELRAFVASLPNSTIIGNEEAEIIPTTSSLYRPLFSFAEAFTTSLPENTSSFLSIDFVISGQVTNMGTCNTIYAASCRVGLLANSAALLALSAPSPTTIATAIASLIPSKPHAAHSNDTDESWSNGTPIPSSSSSPPQPAPALRGVYSFFLALLALLLPASQHTSTGGIPSPTFTEDLLLFCEKALLWKEESFNIRDPWPWWWEWNVKRPFDLLADMLG